MAESEHDGRILSRALGSTGMMSVVFLLPFLVSFAATPAKSVHPSHEVDFTTAYALSAHSAVTQTLQDHNSSVPEW